MEVRMARTVAIAAVITVIGGLVLRGCARRLERRLTALPPAAAIDTASGPPDSARAVALARRAYLVDHTARGETAPPAEVTGFALDSTGYRLEITPRGGGPGARAVVRVSVSGQVELRRVGP